MTFKPIFHKALNLFCSIVKSVPVTNQYSAIRVTFLAQGNNVVVIQFLINTDYTHTICLCTFVKFQNILIHYIFLCTDGGKPRQ